MNSDTYDKGMKVRREMFGDAYVDNAMNSTDELTRPFQELAIEYCFGSIWAREQLPRRTRSLVNVGMLVALNKPHELEIHLGMALSNGCKGGTRRGAAAGHRVLRHARRQRGLPHRAQSIRRAPGREVARARNRRAPHGTVQDVHRRGVH